MSDDPELRRLRWRCRRGMKELDQLLLRYLDQLYPTAESADRAGFLKLLDCEDDRLWRWFLGREAVNDAEIEPIVRRILELV